MPCRIECFDGTYPNRKATPDEWIVLVCAGCHPAFEMFGAMSQFTILRSLSA